MLATAALMLVPLRLPAEVPVTLDPFHTPQIQEIQKLHAQAEAGDKSSTKALISRLETLCAESPDNQLLRAYLGSAYTLASRDAFPGPKKLQYLKDGLKIMDQAVEADPQAIGPRFIRAVNNFHLPAFINRRDNARADFEILLGQVEQPGITLHPATSQAIHYYAGLAFKQLHRKYEARSALQKAWELDRHSELAAKIAAELKKLET
jgi:hypothetical protein